MLKDSFNLLGFIHSEIDYPSDVRIETEEDWLRIIFSAKIEGLEYRFSRSISLFEVDHARSQKALVEIICEAYNRHIKELILRG